MTAFESTLDEFAKERCSAILRTSHESAVQPAMEAAVEGGFRIIEFTLNTPGALEAISAFAERDLLVGAGTVLSTEDAEKAVIAGARFLVSPIMDPDVIAWAVEHQVVIIPGTYTPTEMAFAFEAGAPIVKLFPGPVNGPDYVRSVLGPMPFLKIFPTSGVTIENARAYLEAGAFGIGFVACLFDPEDMRRQNFDAIRARAEQCVQAVRATASPS